MPYGTQKHGIEGAPLVDYRIGHQLLRLEVVLTAVRVIDQIELQSLEIRHSMEHLQPLAGNLGADAVAGENADVV